MYSVVLMLAVTTGGELADAKGCRGCRSCGGGCYSCGCGCYSCGSGCYRGCGCYSGGCYSGGCYSGGCYSSGCYSSGCASYSCGGGCVSYSKCGGGCVSYSCGCAVSSPVIHGHASAPMSYGSYIVQGSVISSPTTATAEDDTLKPGTTLSAREQTWLADILASEKDATEKKKIEDEFTKDSRVGRMATFEVFKKMKENRTEVGATSAAMVVSLPASAKLTIDGATTSSTSNLRTFVSPSLKAGKTYAYVLQAEYQHQGQTVTVSKKVAVQAGKISRVDLGSSATSLASK